MTIIANEIGKSNEAKLSNDWIYHSGFVCECDYSCEGCGEPIELSDISASGRERPWKPHKSSSLLFCESLERIEKGKKAFRVSKCGIELEFGVCPEGHYKKLLHANFCRVRLCPLCTWRRSLKVAHQVKEIVHRVMEERRLRWLYLTLTVRNVTQDKLVAEIVFLIKSFRKLNGRKKFKEAVEGFFRGLEITYNVKEDTYHPHYHLLLGVNPNYFAGRNYMKKKDWAELWQSATGLDYEPVIDVRAVKDKRRIKVEEGILKSKGYIDPHVIAEVSKYTVKSNQYLFPNDEKLTDKVVRTLEEALTGRRLFAFGGCLKEMYKRLQKEKRVEDVESDETDLLHVGDSLGTCTCPTCDSTLLEELYRWMPDRRIYVKF